MASGDVTGSPCRAAAAGSESDRAISLELPIDGKSVRVEDGAIRLRMTHGQLAQAVIDALGDDETDVRQDLIEDLCQL
jgi:hypothetical protein